MSNDDRRCFQREQVNIARMWHELRFQLCHLPVVHLCIKYFSIFTIYFIVETAIITANWAGLLEELYSQSMYKNSSLNTWQILGAQLVWFLFGGEHSNGEYVFLVKHLAILVLSRHVGLTLTFQSDI